MSDLLSVQREIAAKITSNLRLKLSGEQQNRMAKRETANPEAYVLYLKGRYHTAKYTKEGLAKGLEYLDQAIAIDPRYALAYDGIAGNYIAAADWFMASKEALPRASAAAKKALELDDTLAEAHASLATVHWWFDWDWPAAEMEFQRAIQLDPNDARAHQFYGWFLLTLGKSDAAIAENK
jgi:lipoprotein NlpI